MPRILLVEDQATAAAYLSQGLREAGMTVDIAFDGPDGLRQLLTGLHELAILDVMLASTAGTSWRPRAALGTARRSCS